MKHSASTARFLSGALLATCLWVGARDAALAGEPMPETSPDGLRLQQSKDARMVYIRPGASFAAYDRVAILDTDVQFAKKWQRDYNADTAGVQNRVTTADMERMKAGIASEFRKVFAAELQKGDGYKVVESAGPGVLVLRPALLEVQVTAPELQLGDARRTLARSAGQMTLYLELWDSDNKTILARIMDSQEDDSMGARARRMDRGRNKEALDAMLSDWAVKLRKHLDAARAQRPAPQ